MNRKIERPDVVLMSIALSFSKKSGAIVTIKYGNIFINYKDINVQIKLSANIDDFDVAWIDENDGFWRIIISYNKLFNIKEIFGLLRLLLNCVFYDKEIPPVISLPYNYFIHLQKNDCIILDSYFTPTNSKKFECYIIANVNGLKELSIIQPDASFIKYYINIVIRNGEGNEDL